MKTITVDTRRLLLVGTAILAITVVVVALLLSGWLDPGDEGPNGLDAEAVARAPRLAIDMDPAGNSYDDATNSMSVGEIDYCLETAAPGNNKAHTHAVHLVITGVEDLVGWQARLNYDGAEMRPLSVNFTPFADRERGQSVSFVNLPLDSATDSHREVAGASNIAPPGEGPQTALIGSVYGGRQTLEVSPDTPAKPVPDDSSYRAPQGGVLALITLEVAGDQAGPGVLFIDVDDDVPNAPESSAIVFTGDGAGDSDVVDLELGDGFHGEGALCLVAGAVPTVNTPPTPGPTITIKDRQVQLPVGMFYGEAPVPELGYGPVCPTPKQTWEMFYRPDLDDADVSIIVFDQDYNLISSQIYPEDRDAFEPILDALDPPYDPFARVERSVIIHGRRVILVPDMNIGQVGGPYLPLGAQPPIWMVEYDSNRAEAGDSSLTFDSNCTLLGSHIRPEDEEQFQPLLDAFADP